jgi:hypothetical protein
VAGEFQSSTILKNEHQYLRIPKSYVTPNAGVKLGQWASTQRKMLKPFMDKNGNVKVGIDKKNEERIDLLKNNGFIWDIYDIEWEEHFNLLLSYKNEHQHLRIPQVYVTPTGVNLGIWVKTQRHTLKPFMDTNGNAKVGTDKAIRERIDRLKAIGFVWAKKAILVIIMRSDPHPICFGRVNQTRKQKGSKSL